MTTTAPTPPRHRWYADLCLATTAIIWGINIPVFKHAMGQLDPWVFNATRLVAATITLGICAWIESRVVAPSRKPFPYALVVIYGLMTGFVYQLFFVWGITRTTAGNTALLMATMPVWTAAISFLFIRERLPKWTWIGLLVTFIGTVIVITQSGNVNLSPKFLAGNLLMLVASILWAAGTVLSRPILHSISALRLAFWGSAITSPLHVAIAWGRFDANLEKLQQWTMIGTIAFSGVFSTGLAYVSWHIGVRQLGGSYAAVYQNLVTLVAVLGGWIFLREQPMIAQIFGGAFIVLGMMAMRQRPSNHK